jgi:hypothetical protein
MAFTAFNITHLCGQAALPTSCPLEPKGRHSPTTLPLVSQLKPSIHKRDHDALATLPSNGCTASTRLRSQRHLGQTENSAPSLYIRR